MTAEKTILEKIQIFVHLHEEAAVRPTSKVASRLKAGRGNLEPTR